MASINLPGRRNLRILVMSTAHVYLTGLMQSIVGSMCAALASVFKLLGHTFELFRPARVTCCTDGVKFDIE